MDVFWDTSGMVALLLQEPGTIAAQKAWGKTSRPWCWRWLQVETEAALARRRASATAWANWRTVAMHLTCLDLEASLWSALRAFNRPLRLRASDAGHLFVFERAISAVPSLSLFTLDSEMSRAAKGIGLPTLTT